MLVYGKLRVCVRGFSEGKSDVANTQRPLFKHKTSNFLYTVLCAVFYSAFICSVKYEISGFFLFTNISICFPFFNSPIFSRMISRS
ncbi:hypothetical protein CXF67_08320 [Psychroflexus sp. MES1-P1E]|nr:hypothetical protein CXF67_08320 [Psychroflexus sp. MES1-P1E]